MLQKDTLKVGFAASTSASSAWNLSSIFKESIIVVYVYDFSSLFWTGLVAVFERHTSQILIFRGRPNFYSRHGTAMVWLWHDYGTAMVG